MAALPADFPAPLALALHIPAGYTEALARRLDASSALEVVEAEDGMELRPGPAVLARAGHAPAGGAGRAAGRWCGWTASPPGAPHRPSVDVLFQSAAAGLGRGRAWGWCSPAWATTGWWARAPSARRAGTCSRSPRAPAWCTACRAWWRRRACPTRSAPLEDMVALLERYVR